MTTIDPVASPVHFSEARSAVEVLKSVRSQLPGGQERPGQDAMAAAVQEGIASRRPVIVQAGTGVGKSLAYLIPAILSGKKVLVITASIALQDQLDKKDLPFLATHTPRPFTWSIMKGRNNYWCLQKADEFAQRGDSLFDDEFTKDQQQQIEQLLAWSATTDSGDKAESGVEADYKVNNLFFSTTTECVGKSKCPRGEDCYTESAKERAALSQVVVSNMHLWGAHLSSLIVGQGRVLPEYDVLIIDEAHEMPDIVSGSLGADLYPSELTAAGKMVKTVAQECPESEALEAAGDELKGVLDKLPKERIDSGCWGSAPFAELSQALQGAEASVLAARRVVDDVRAGNEAMVNQQTRATKALDQLQEKIGSFLDTDKADYVYWVDEGKMCSRPISLAGILRDWAWPDISPILCSATLFQGFNKSVGLPGVSIQQVASPFRFKSQALLYVPESIDPPPKASAPPAQKKAYDKVINKHVETLVYMSDGRALVLCTSNKRKDEIYEYLQKSKKVVHRVWKQGELPKNDLIEAYKEDTHSILVATRSFWMGVDIPGEALSMLIIDKLPFPQPNDPLLQARRERLGGGYQAFVQVDVPQAATTLAQGVGRLIRSETDTGVVAILDTRLATASYKELMLGAMPPFRRVRNLDTVQAFLERINKNYAG